MSRTFFWQYSLMPRGLANTFLSYPLLFFGRLLPKGRPLLFMAYFRKIHNARSNPALRPPFRGRYLIQPSPLSPRPLRLQGHEIISAGSDAGGRGEGSLLILAG